METLRAAVPAAAAVPEQERQRELVIVVSRTVNSSIRRAACGRNCCTAVTGEVGNKQVEKRCWVGTGEQPSTAAPFAHLLPPLGLQSFRIKSFLLAFWVEIKIPNGCVVGEKLF